jgi:hypothetical protein
MIHQTQYQKDRANNATPNTIPKRQENVCSLVFLV